MIPLSMDTAFVIYLLAWLLTIGILWGRRIRHDSVTEWNLHKTRLFRCDQCHYAFVNKENVTITRCPRCNSICIFRKRKRF